MGRGAAGEKQLGEKKVRTTLTEFLDARRVTSSSEIERTTSSVEEEPFGTEFRQTPYGKKPEHRETRAIEIQAMMFTLTSSTSSAACTSAWSSISATGLALAGLTAGGLQGFTWRVGGTGSVVFGRMAGLDSAKASLVPGYCDSECPQRESETRRPQSPDRGGRSRARGS